MKLEGSASETWIGSCKRMQSSCNAALRREPELASHQLPSGPLPCPPLPKEPGRALGQLQERGEPPLCCCSEQGHALLHLLCQVAASAKVELSSCSHWRSCTACHLTADSIMHSPQCQQGSMVSHSEPGEKHPSCAGSGKHSVLLCQQHSRHTLTWPGPPSLTRQQEVPPMRQCQVARRAGSSLVPRLTAQQAPKWAAGSPGRPRSPSRLPNPAFPPGARLAPEGSSPGQVSA